MLSAKGKDGQVEKEVYQKISCSRKWVRRFIVIFLILVVYIFLFKPEWGFKLCLKSGFEDTCRQVWDRELGLIGRAARWLSG